ncbi:MAG TPA: helicase-associated domain-containing protein, partial [Frankiaceae bacterium]|nr:helicase-associated domain-containing protein [Frankiaceae bacterium]
DGLVAGRADPAEVDAALGRLSARALAWPDGDRVRVAGGARHCWDLPAGLGCPARQLLATLTLADLDVVARRHGARPARPKAALVEQTAHLLDDADRVRALVEQAPAPARELLSPLVDPGARLTIYNSRVTSTGVRTPVGWLLAHGLLVPADYTTAEVPREVALALRGGRVLLDVVAGPPELSPRPVQTSAAGPRAVDALLAAVQTVAAEVDARPPAQLKDGGLGVRELRRLAVAAGVEERTARAVLELLATAGLLAPTRDDVLLTREYDSWADQPPARRWATLATAWLGCPHALVPPDPKRAALVPLWVRGLSEGMRTLREDLLGVLADLPDGAGADPRDLAARLAWSRPLRYGTDLDPLRRGLADTLAEAELLGIAVGGALTPAGRAALLEGPDAAVDLLAPRLAGAATTVTLQADLTAIVAGPPAAPLAALLDRVADRESRDTASVWRFSPASVRRALDAGTRAEALLGELATAAAGTVPQALTYLVRDVARAHGRLRVGTAGCYLRSEDPALAAEVLRARKLAGLRLRSLAPTVLASAADPDETLAKLRAAGYAPVREDRDGDLVLARAGRRRAASAASRATAAGRPRPTADGPPAVDPADLARRLLSGQPPAPVPGRRPGYDGLPRPGDDPLP